MTEGTAYYMQGVYREMTGTTYMNVGMKKPGTDDRWEVCLLYTSPSPRDGLLSRMPSSA